MLLIRQSRKDSVKDGIKMNKRTQISLVIGSAMFAFGAVQA
ncbi:hypothetical protein VCHA54P499_180060 [Vibrio chagasii]|nr:hypothetical protein VCHA54P499_180060 [Vibrio chagasii]CAH7143252.1 hypothetical protein VCHA53O466_210062 [Vibrio chagasii]